MKLFRILLFAGFACGSASPALMAAPAKFWLSYSNVDPDGLEAPEIASVQNATRYLYIWGQPGTANAALPYDVVTNRFKTIQNFSLDLMTDVAANASDPILDLIDGTFTVYNPVSDGKPRFQYTADSHSSIGAIVSTDGALDGVQGLQGFSLAVGAGNGIGHSVSNPTLGCNPNDAYCAPTNDAQQSPAWLVASVGVKTTATVGNSYLHLQIGQNGMSYAAPAAQIPEVVFGLNSPDPGPSYNSTLPADRQLTKSTDNPDASIAAFDPANVPLSTWNGTSGTWGDSSWAGGVPSSFAKDAKLPASLGANVVTVSGKQVANETLVEGGRLHIPAGASLASKITVAPGGAISGQGWVGSDLIMQSGATLTVDSLQPLLVVGSTNVAGAQVRLGSNFNGSSSTPIEILRSLSGIQGSLASMHNQSLGGGLVINTLSKSTDGTSLMLTVSGITGDYNQNNVVDAADYVLWRKSVGCSTSACLVADGNHDGIVNESDLTVWRVHFGQSASGSAALVSFSTVPEPAIATTVLVAGIISLLRRRNRETEMTCWPCQPRAQSSLIRTGNRGFLQYCSSEVAPQTSRAGR